MPPSNMLGSDMLSSLFEKIPKKEKPSQIYYRGDVSLLGKRKIAIVGSRKASKYSKYHTSLLASRLSKAGFAVVSGGAEGIDSEAHKGAGQNTVAVMPCGLDILYPPSNSNLLKNVYENSLAISEYKEGEGARAYTFVHRNRLVVGMSEAVVISEADQKSGSIRSAEYALKYGIPLYVLSHRIDESLGTNALIREKKAKPIFSIDDFLDSLGVLPLTGDTSFDESEQLRAFLASHRTFADLVDRYGDKAYEMELEGVIAIENGAVKLIQS